MEPRKVGEMNFVFFSFFLQDIETIEVSTTNFINASLKVLKKTCSYFCHHRILDVQYYICPTVSFKFGIGTDFKAIVLNLLLVDGMCKISKKKGGERKGKCVF